MTFWASEAGDLPPVLPVARPRGQILRGFEMMTAGWAPVVMFVGLKAVIACEYNHIYIYIYTIYTIINHYMPYLVGGIPTPLKNDGVRQLG